MERSSLSREMVSATLDQTVSSSSVSFDIRNVPAALAIAKFHDTGMMSMSMRLFLTRWLYCWDSRLVRRRCLAYRRMVLLTTAHDTGVKRAIDIVRGAQLVRAQNHIVGIFARDHDDRQIVNNRSARQIGQHLKAAHVRHDNVQQHERQLIAIAVDHIERRTTVISLEDAILVLEHLVENGSVHLGVIDDKHPKAFRFGRPST